MGAEGEGGQRECWPLHGRQTGDQSGDQAGESGGSGGWADPEGGGELIGDDEQGASGQIADDDRAADVLQEVGEAAVSGDDEEGAGEENEHGQHVIALGGWQKRQAAENEKGGGVGGAENGVPRTRKQRSDQRGDGGAGQAMGDGDTGHGGEGQSLRDGQERHVEPGGHVMMELGP